MKQYFEIVDVMAREILDSDGNPTVEVEVTLDEGTVGRAAVPAGGTEVNNKALQLRDGDPCRYNGQGVLTAVESVNGEIAEALLGLNVLDQPYIDKILLELDGTEDKSRLGANALLGVSLACAAAASEAVGLSLYNYIGGCNAKLMPVPVMSVYKNGKGEAGAAINEFMLMPVGAESFREALRMCSEVFREIKKATAAPGLAGTEEVLDMLERATERAGYVFGEDIKIALDAGASSGGECRNTATGSSASREQRINMWTELVEKYPVALIENAMDAGDLQGWAQLTARLGGRTVIAGSDRLASDSEALCAGIKAGAANAVVVKPNRAGTLTEILDIVRAAQHAGWRAVLSGCSGETEDTSIADIAVAVNAGLIKVGPICGGESIAKYNRLLRIEEELFDVPRYPGEDVLF